MLKRFASLVIDVDSRKVKSGSKDIDGLAASGKRAETASDRLARSVRSMGGVVATALSIRQIVGYADAWKGVENRMRIVSKTSQDLAVNTGDVFRIAQTTRQELDSTAQLYQRLSENQGELNTTGAETSRITETIAKAMAIGGSSAIEQAGATRQLSQAFASGVLRGEELNSVLENAPALARAIADGLGVPVGALKELGEQGAITSKQLVDGLLSQSRAIDSQFSEIEATVSQSFTVLNNSTTRFVGELDAAVGSSGLLTGSILGLAEVLDSGAIFDSVTRQTELWSGFITLTEVEVRALDLALADLRGEGGKAVSDLSGAFADLPANVRAFTQIAGIEVANFLARSKAIIKSAKEEIKAIFTDDTIADVNLRLRAELENLEKVKVDSIVAVLNERDVTLAAADQKIVKIKEERAELDALVQKRKEAGNISAGSAGVVGLSVDGEDKESQKKADQLARQLDQVLESLLTEEALLSDSHKRRNDVLQEAYDNRLLTDESYLEQRGKLDQQHAGQQSKLQAEQFKSRIEGTRTLFQNLSVLSASGNTRLAKIGQAAAITTATIDGIVAVQKALASSGPPANYISAAAVGLAAGANVAAISGQFHSGGTVPADGSYALKGGEEILTRQQAKEISVKGGSNVQVVVNNNAGAEVSVTSEQNSQGELISIAVDQAKQQLTEEVLRGGGDFSNALESSLSVQRVAM